MFKPGLVSISFRKLRPSEIATLCVQAGLQAVEWGGDVHAPHGDLRAAREVRKISEDSGLEIACYGSYFRAGVKGPDNPDFESVLASAKELGAPVIRVWAGNVSSRDAAPAVKRAVIDDLARAGSLAKANGAAVSMEFHCGTLNDGAEPSLELLKELSGSGVATHWQPSNGASFEACAEGLKKILPSLSLLHVFHWTKTGDAIDRRPLSEGEARWMSYFSIAASSRRDHCALLEFVRDDSPERLLRDAAVLKRMLAGVRS